MYPMSTCITVCSHVGVTIVKMTVWALLVIPGAAVIKAPNATWHATNYLQEDMTALCYHIDVSYKHKSTHTRATVCLHTR